MHVSYGSLIFLAGGIWSCRFCFCNNCTFLHFLSDLHCKSLHEKKCLGVIAGAISGCETLKVTTVDLLSLIKSMTNSMLASTVHSSPIGSLDRIRTMWEEYKWWFQGDILIKGIAEQWYAGGKWGTFLVFMQT